MMAQRRDNVRSASPLSSWRPTAYLIALSGGRASARIIALLVAGIAVVVVGAWLGLFAA